MSSDLRPGLLTWLSCCRSWRTPEVRVCRSRGRCSGCLFPHCWWRRPWTPVTSGTPCLEPAGPPGGSPCWWSDLSQTDWVKFLDYFQRTHLYYRLRIDKQRTEESLWKTFLRLHQWHQQYWFRANSSPRSGLILYSYSMSDFSIISKTIWMIK